MTYLKELWVRRLLLLGSACAAVLALTLLIYAIITLIRFASLSQRPLICEGSVEECSLVATTIYDLPGQGANITSITFSDDHVIDLNGYTGLNGDMWIAGELTDAQKRAVMIHEYGHVVDFFRLVDTPGGKISPFLVRNVPVFSNDPSLQFYRISWANATQQLKYSKAANFVTAYARKGAIEDFAESFAYYVLAPQAFEKRAQKNPVLKKKLQFIQGLFSSDFRVVTVQNWDGTVPSSTEDLSFLWEGNTL